VTAKTIVLIGPSGSGKTTIATQLAQATGMAIISTGQQLRAEIHAQSTLGRQIEPLLEQGQLAPDEVMAELMRSWLRAIPPSQDCLIEGYPRSIAQACMLDTILAELGRQLHAVIVLELDGTEIVRRLSGRRIWHKLDGQEETIHIDNATKMAQYLAEGGTLSQREDDQPAVIRARLRIYEQQAKPIIDYYETHVPIYRIHADQSPAAIVAAIRDII